MNPRFDSFPLPHRGRRLRTATLLLVPLGCQVPLVGAGDDTDGTGTDVDAASSTAGDVTQGHATGAHDSAGPVTGDAGTGDDAGGSGTTLDVGGSSGDAGSSGGEGGEVCDPADLVATPFAGPCNPQIPADDVVLDAEPFYIHALRDPTISGRVAHVLSMYEPLYGRITPVDVRFDLAGENTLVLRSFNETNWNIELGSVGQLERVVVVGFYGMDRVTAPEGVEVVYADAEMLSAINGGTYDDCPDAYDYDCLLLGLAEAISHELCIPVANVDLVHDGTRFEYATPADCGGVSDPPAPRCQDPVPTITGHLQDDCGTIEAESARCAMLYYDVDTGGAFVEYLGLDTGDTCSGPELGFSPLGVSPGAWIGDRIFAVTSQPDDVTVAYPTEIDLNQASVAIEQWVGPVPETPPRGVLALTDTFVAAWEDGAFTEHADAVGLAAQSPIATYQAPAPLAATPIAIDGGQLYELSLQYVYRSSWPDLAPQGVSGFACYPGYTPVVTAFDGELLFASFTDILRYDPVSSELLGAIAYDNPPNSQLQGIMCRP